MEQYTEITNDTIKVESLIFAEYICLCCHLTVNQLDCPDYFMPLPSQDAGLTYLVL